MAKKKVKITEVELAKKIIEWLELNGWEVFQEVRKEWGHPTADIVAQKDNITWVIETKTSFTLDVMEQADYWVGKANQVSIGIPSGTTKGWRDHAFRTKVCKHLGVGILIYGPDPNDRYNLYPHIVQIKLEPLKANKCSHDWSKILKPEHKTYCEAGATSAKHRFTPFRNTLDQLIVVVRDNPGIILKDAVGLIKHHYKKDTTAEKSLYTFIHDGVIKELEFKYDPEINRNRLYLRELP
jgi:hypothetical protein